MMRPTFTLFFSVAVYIILVVAGSGCANIIPPTGGARDSLPPVLLSATPRDSSTKVNPSRITLTFDEYLNPLQGVENVIISPTLATTPNIESKLRTVTVRFRDTLEPNTTYSINFGNAITDVNEGNILKNFTYVFSTGKTIATGTLGGRVVLAETGKTDSTLIVVLHRNLADSAVVKERPRYYAKLDGSGNFTFNNLPPGLFAIYALPNDFTKQYDDSTKRFAFLNNPVTVSDTTLPVTLYAYEQEKRRVPTSSTSSPGTTGNKGQDKRLRFNNPEAGAKDILTPLQLEFVRKLKVIDTSKIILTDTAYNRIGGYTIITDSTRTKLLVRYPWQLSTRYKLLIMKDAITDTTGISITKNDTITIDTKKADDYGKVRVRFNNIDLGKNPVLQIVQNDQVLESIPLTSREWTRDLYKPGEYELRILYDRNKNGVWDPGNFRKKVQPEIVQPVQRTLTVKGRWENEVDITL